MAVKIRLRRMGSKGKPFYRLVVADSRAPRDGRFIDTLGYYDPCTEPATVKIDEEKALMWLGRGAQPTEIAQNLLKRGEILDKFAASKQATQPTEASAPVETAPEAAPAPKRRSKAAKVEAEAPAVEAEATPVTEAEGEEQSS